MRVIAHTANIKSKQWINRRDGMQIYRETIDDFRKIIRILDQRNKEFMKISKIQEEMMSKSPVFQGFI